MGRAPSPKGRGDLTAYAAKRDFTKTLEPDIVGNSKEGKRFVVQHHWATRDHFDFRLELNGVLKSWAVTRGPSANPKDKRLAVETEDHPIDYAEFEGTIPKGNYGGGTVMLWDEGLWESHDADPEDAHAKGIMKFELFGHRMHGSWTLVRMKPRNEREKEHQNWLLIKEHDQFVEGDDSLASRFTQSVRSNRDRDQIARGAPEHKSGKGIEFIPPSLCELHDDPPDGEDWVHEIKYDGYRMQIAKRDDDVRIFTRAGHDWTKKFINLASDAATIDARETMIDGEIVVLDEKGLSNFVKLVDALEKKRQTITFMAFDLLRLDGKDLRGEPLLKRKERLQVLLGEKGVGHIRYAGHLSGDGETIYRKAVDGGAEGIVSKLARSRYRSGRHGDWIKVKAVGRDDFVIIGWLPSEKGREFSALLLATPDDDGLRFVGRVGTGFSASKQREILDAIGKAKQKTAPNGIKNLINVPRNACWVTPVVTAEIAFAGWTGDHQLRHARFLSLRHSGNELDEANLSSPKAKASVSKAETLEKTPQRKARPVAKVSRADMVDFRRLTHPERVLFPDNGLTKLQLAEYLVAIAPRILPHLADRPVSFVRAPDDIEHELFFQRHALKGMELGIEQTNELHHGKAYVMIDGVDGLVTAAQFSVIELHGWSARSTTPNAPDRLIFDLDPDGSITFADVKKSAFEFRDMLDAAGLKTFPLVSGGKGVHVIAPLDQTNSWEEVEGFTEGFARKLAAIDPKRYVAVMTKSKRIGRIFIDYLRNKSSATAIVPFSVRARKGAPIALPVTWDGLASLDAANGFRMQDATDMKADPWAGFFETKQRVSKETLKILK